MEEKEIIERAQKYIAEEKDEAFRSEVENLLKEKFAEVISSKNKGVIMKTVMSELKGKADGKVISEVVAKLCN